MDHHHTFDYAEGTLACPIAPEIKAYFPSTDTYYQYYDISSASSMHDALSQLHAYIEAEGPFDGVLAFSQGASLAATYLFQHAQNHPSKHLPFKCAIFFSGGRPLDPMLLAKGERKLLEPEELEVPRLRLPTAHIWGKNDTLWPGTSEVLCELCEEGERTVFVHEEGHDIPGARAKEAVQGSLRAIRRTVDNALMRQ